MNRNHKLYSARIAAGGGLGPRDLRHVMRILCLVSESVIREHFIILCSIINFHQILVSQSMLIMNHVMTNNNNRIGRE